MDKSERRAAAVLLRAAMLICLLGLSLAPGALAGGHASGHAPIGVMADHTHHRGETMLSYRYMRMEMNGLRDGDERISRRKVLEDFMVTPTSMDMEMHMFGVMHSPIEGLTVMLMVPFVRKEMDHLTRMGGTFTTRSDGLGDVTATAMIALWSKGHHKVHAHLGIGFPTGSITEEDKLPTSGGTTVRLPYPMQIGSGSYEFLPGLTYAGHSGLWSWGAQGRGEIRLNENHAGYRLGNEYALTTWGALDAAKWLSVSLRAEWRQNLNINGREESSSVNPAIVPTADPGRRAAASLSLLGGVNFALPEGMLSGVRLALEVGVPVYQTLDGPALETDWMMTAGVQYAF
jgi:hypothetical protein